MFPALTYSFQGASEMLVLDVKWKSVRGTVKSGAVANTHTKWGVENVTLKRLRYLPASEVSISLHLEPLLTCYSVA